MGQLLTMKPALASRAALIDEAGEIRLKLDAFAATGLDKRAGQLAAEFASWYEKSDAAREYTERGERFQLSVSPCRNVTAISVAASYKLLGIKKLLAAATVTLKALRAYLTEEQIANVSTVARTGSRSFQTVPLGLPVAVCLGCYALNNACGKCEKCAAERDAFFAGTRDALPKAA